LSSPNAGTGNPGEFLKLDRQLHQATLRVSTMAHLEMTDHFGAKLAKRRRSGLLLAGAMGAENGVPCMAIDGAAKAYVRGLGEALHYTGQSVLYQTLCRPNIEA
jgi:short-subunit dehydrogenase